MGERYSVAPDGHRFLINVQLDDESSRALTVVVNWNGDLSRKK